MDNKPPTKLANQNFFVFTGGPGAGKTTLLNAPREEGFEYMDESARIIIKQRLAQGLPPRPPNAEFAKRMFEMDYANFVANQAKTEVVFFDRSLLDSACLLYEADKEYYEEIKATVNNCLYNQKVFITPPWPEIYTTDSERDQTFDEAIMVFDKLYQWYKAHGYEPIEVPKAPVEDRVGFIITTISSQAATRSSTS